MSGLLVTGAFVLSAMTVGLAGLDVLFTEVWPGGPDDPWYVFAAQSLVGAVTFVGVAAVPAFVVTVASPSQLAILTLVTLPPAAVAYRYILRV